jgi:integrase
LKEAEIEKGTYRGASTRTVADLLNRYAKEVSPTKPGDEWEQMQIAAFIRRHVELAEMPLNEVNSEHFGKWRDTRLETVSAATVLREINLLSHCFTTARKEWKWIAESPLTGVRRPKEPKSRDRLIAPREREALHMYLGYKEGETPQNMMGRIGAMFDFAIETGMRAGEIVGLEWKRVHLDKKYVHLDETKNGDARDVALSARARAILKEMEPLKDQFEGNVFGVSSASLDALFRKARDHCAIEDLHFHDTRHEAITRLSEKLDVLELARMVGVRDLKILMVYYNKKATHIADSLG